MQVTVDVQRKPGEDLIPESLCTKTVDVAGLEEIPSADQLATPAYIRVRFRITADDTEIDTEITTPVKAQEPDEEAPLEADEAKQKGIDKDKKDDKRAPGTPEPGKEAPDTQEPPPPPGTPSEPESPIAGDLQAVRDENAAAEPAAGLPETVPPESDTIEPEVEPAAQATTPDGKPQTIEEFQQQVGQAAESIPEPFVSRGGGSFAAVGAEGGDKLSKQRAATEKEAEKNALPKPVPDHPPPVTPENPVPHALWLIDRTSTTTLPDQVPPKFENSPLGNVPALGDQALDSEKLAAVKSRGKQLAAEAKAEEEAQAALEAKEKGKKKKKGKEDKEAPVKPELSATDKDLKATYEKLNKPADPKAEVAEPEAIKTKRDPPPLLTLKKGAKTENIADVFARLLTDPKKTAEDAIKDFRRSMYAGGVVDRVFPELGNDRIPGLTTSLEKQFRDIATKAGASAEQLDAAVAKRRESLENKSQQVRAETKQESADAQDKVKKESALTKAAIASNADSVIKKADDDKASAQQKNPKAEAAATRDRLVEEARTKSATLYAQYRRIGEQRQAVLGSTMQKYTSAYTLAEQKDEIQIEADTKLTPEERKRQIDASQNWLRGPEGVLKRTSTTFGEFKKSSESIISTAQTSVDTARDQAIEEIRQWARTKTGDYTNWFFEWIQSFIDHAAQTRAKTEAWRSIQNEREAVVTNQYINQLVDIEAAAGDKEKEQAMLADQTLSSEQRMIAASYFKQKSGDSKEDPLMMIAEGIRGRVMVGRREEMFKSMNDEMLASDNWKGLGEVGAAIGSPANIEARARQIYKVGLHGGIFGRNDVDVVMKNLSDLNEIQVAALKKAYKAIFGIGLDEDLKDQLDAAGEYDRAQDLMKGDKESAMAAELYAAGEGKVGTDEDAIFRILRGLTPDQMKKIKEVYKQRYGTELKDALKSELDDWSVSTSHDADRGDALLNLNVEKADAIAMDQALYTGFWGASREDAEKVYANVRDDVRREAQQKGLGSEWMDLEIKARLIKMEGEYDKKYAGQYIPGSEQFRDPNTGQIPDAFRRGTMRQNFKSTLGEYDADVLLNLQVNNLAGADAARIKAERESLIYVSDEKINKVLLSQYERARQDESLDSEPALRYLEKEKMRAEEEKFFQANKRFWDPETRYKRQQEMKLAVERQLDAKAEARSKQYMDKLSDTYSANYGESLTYVVATYTSDSWLGSDRSKAEALLKQGHLTNYQKLKFGMEGAGTNEELVKSALKGLTAKEIEQLEADWDKEHPNGPSLRKELESEMSGEDWIETQLSLKGRPMTIDDAVEVAKERERLNRPGSLGQKLFKGEDAMAQGAVDDLIAMRDHLRDPANAKLTPEQQDVLLQQFDAHQEMVSEAIEARNTVVSSVTDSLINAISIAVAVVVGVVGSIFTAGAAAAVALAIIASIVTTATSIGLRVALLGGRYGTEELWTDIGIGVIDAVVAGLTAGMGNRLLGLKQIGMQAAQKGAMKAVTPGILGRFRGSIVNQMSKLGNVGKIAQSTKSIGFLEKMAASEAKWYSKVAAHGISQVIENTVQSVPSAVAANVVNEENWKQGNPLFNILKNTGAQVGVGLAQGLAFSGGQHLVTTAGSHIVGVLKGPKLGTESYLRFSQHLSEPEYNAYLKDYQQAHPGAVKADFDAVLQRERAIINEKAEVQQKMRESVREQINDALPERLKSQFDDVPITQLNAVEFARVAGIGAPDVHVIVKDGQVHVLVRAGVEPAAIKQHMEAVAGKIRAEVEPGTGGRVKDAGQALPKSLRDVPFEVNDKLPHGTVHVWFDGGTVRVEIGPGVSAKVLHQHVGTIREQVRLNGALKSVHQLKDRISFWMTEHGFPDPGSKAWVAKKELDKLGPILESHQHELSNPDLTPHRRAAIEGQISHLLDKVQEHRQNLDNWDLTPSDGFIAVSGLPERTRVYKEEMRGDVESYPRTHVEDSPLKSKDVDSQGKTQKVDKVLQVGEEWVEGGRVYRLVEGLDANGKRLALYEEIYSVKDNWVMRGEEISGKGAIGEKASKLQMQDVIRRQRQKGLPDFLVEAQNSQGQGFDKVRVEFAKTDIEPDGKGGYRLKKDAKPTLVIGEDKNMGQVSFESITAIKENLLSNLRDLKDKLDSGEALLPVKDGGLGLTKFQADALQRAMERGKWRFEVRVFDDASLGNVSGKSGTQKKGMIIPRLKQSIESRLRSSAEFAAVDEKGKVVKREIAVQKETITKGYLKKAAAVVEAENRIGVVPTVYEKALQMKLNPSDPENLRAAWVAIKADAEPFKVQGGSIDPATNILTDKSGRAFKIVSPENTAVHTNAKAEKLADTLLDHLQSTPKTAKGGPATPFVILDLSRMPKSRADALRAALAQKAAKRGMKDKLSSILSISDTQPRLEPMIPPKIVPCLLSTSPTGVR